MVATFSASQVYKVVVEGSLLGQAANNIYYYGRTGPFALATPLMNIFVSSVIPALLQGVNENYLLKQVTVTNEDDPDDYDTTIVNAFGDRPGEPTGSFDAWGFRLLPTLASIQTGAKRLAGVSEGDLSSGVATALQIIRLGITANKMAETLPNATGDYSPVIKSLTFPLGITFLRYCSLAGAAYNWYTTQNSRKVGRGS